jgi:acyl transferase domain-containing protein/surfactin synthase thioesterase subunit/acyl carrier protein
MKHKNEYNGQEVAVVGMAGRFPGASDLEVFWKNISAGKECITFATDDELEALGVDKKLINSEKYVKAKGGLLDNSDCFDASFFGYTPIEAELMDPQIRVFLECAWNALEDAGYNADKLKRKVGVYAGASSNYHWTLSSLSSDKSKTIGLIPSICLVDKDYLSSRVSHKFNLSGPSFTIQSACATSLVAVHIACQALIDGECEMALTGGASIYSQEKVGYIDQDDSYASSDGHCRAFDAKASGTIMGEGVGVVVLKLLEDAVRDRDYIYAVVKGTAVNNDGFEKASYIAPSVDGQKRVIKQALATAQIEPESISYIEAHGTGTKIGDPIEVEAIQQAFGDRKPASCAIGSVKSNIGHLNAAAGIASFIKVVLALKNRVLPPSINYRSPNPLINFRNSPFYVNTQLKQWEIDEYPLRAGVSSFGIGGTNAHVILEQAPVLQGTTVSARKIGLIAFSARNSDALNRYLESFDGFLTKDHQSAFDDIIYTQNIGRKNSKCRTVIVYDSEEDAINKLKARRTERIRYVDNSELDRPVIFMASGQGSEYENMGLGIYETEPFFRDTINGCFKILNDLMGEDIKDILYPRTDASCAASKINDPLYSGPIKFSFEYSIAKLLMHWGIGPTAMIGHSLGEYVCACLSGVIGLEDALKLVVIRNRLMDRTKEGKMMSVPLSEDEILAIADDSLSIAAVNDSRNCVVSGTENDISQLYEALKGTGVECVIFNVKRAGHSKLMAPIVDEYERAVKSVTFRRPNIPFISGTSGTWITQEEAMDPRYWSRHIINTIRFSAGLNTLLEIGRAAFVQIGSDRGPVSFVQSQKRFTENNLATNAVRNRREVIADEKYLMTTIGRLWQYGVEIDWETIYEYQSRSRVPLPVYPFERRQYTIQNESGGKSIAELNLTGLDRERRSSDIFYVPTWKRTEYATEKSDIGRNGTVLVFMDNRGWGSQLADKIELKTKNVVRISSDGAYAYRNDREYSIDIYSQEHYRTLIGDVTKKYGSIGHVIHALSVGSEDGPSESRVRSLLERGYYSLVYLVQALGYCDVIDRVAIDVLTNNMHDVIGGELTCPEKAPLIGAINVIEAEYKNVSCRNIDIDLSRGTKETELVDRVLREIETITSDSLVAFRGYHRWTRQFEKTTLAAKMENAPQTLKTGGVYLIVGGLGRVGTEIAKWLADRVQAKIVVLQRTPIPKREEWSHIMATDAQDSDVRRKIRTIIDIEKRGSEIFPLSADISDKDQVQRAIDRALKRFGKIDGVFQCAMHPGGSLIQDWSRTKIDEVFAPKVLGTLVLEEVLNRQSLDIVVLCSSISSILPAAGKAAYCGANAFLDAYAHCKNVDGIIRVVSINWNHWEGTPIDVAPETAEFVKQNGVNKAEGIEILERILNGPKTQVLISRENPDQYAKLLKDFSLEGYAEATIKIEGNSGLLEEYRKSVEYVPPRNDREKKIAKIWETFLGYSGIGIADDFFQLGGDSLKALHIIPKINSDIGCRVSIANFYRYPTVERMATYLDSGQRDQTVPIRRITSGVGKAVKTMVCVPYAAGSSSTFLKLAKEIERLNQKIEIYAIEYPGNDLDSDEKSKKDIEDIISKSLEVIKNEVETPVVVYGHCVGSYIALDLGERLEDANIKVDFVGVGGILNDVLISTQDIENMNENDLKEIYLKLGTFRGDDAKIPEQEFARIGKNFKEDAWLITEHRMKMKEKRNGKKLKAPIINIISKSDQTTPGYQEKYTEWKEYSDEVRLIEIDGGGHYFIDEKAGETAAIIERIISEPKLRKN